MDLRQLLGKLTLIEGTMSGAEQHPTGPKFGGYWKGTQKTPPKPGQGVGGMEETVKPGMMKDLAKVVKEKKTEWTLEEEYREFINNLDEENLGTNPKRPNRKSDRPARGHKEQPRYKTIKADESYMSEKDIELQDYRSMTNQEFQTAYGISKTEWINQNKALVIQNPDIKRALGLEEGAADQVYTVNITRYRHGRDDQTRSTSGTIPELLDYFGYTLEVGKSYERERGRYKINMNPRNINQLVDALNKAASNGAANGAASTYYSVGGGQLEESHYKWEITFRDGKRAIYHQNNPHYKDETAASDIRYILKSNPGATVVAYKDGEAFDWESLLSEDNEISVAGRAVSKEPGYHSVWHRKPGSDRWTPVTKYADLKQAERTKADLEKQGFEVIVREGWESGPEEYKEPYDDADDAYDRRRQEKIDAEAEAEWAKKPKKTTYQLLGRGPNMEPNHKFGGEFDDLDAAKEYRRKLMANPKTPHPEHIGIHTIERVIDEAVMGGGHIKNLADYTAKRDYIYQQLADPKQQDNYAYFRQALFDLNRQAKQLGIKIEESRAHKQLSTWFKNRELADKFAKGELKIPTPQERRAELEKPKKKVDEYGATSQPVAKPVYAQQSAGTTTPDVSKLTPQQKQELAQKLDPKTAAQTAQAANQLKAATNSPTPAPNLVKALDAASKGQATSSADMKMLQPMMDILKKAGTDPKLGNQFKTLATQARQIK